MIYEVNTPLTITGVIATIVSLIFACAALINSHRRRKHAQNMRVAPKGPVTPPPEEVLRKHTQELVRKMTPPPEAAPPPPPPPPPASWLESHRQAPVQPHQPVAVEIPAGSSSSPIFRKLGLHGVEESAQKVDDTQYRWE